ncbi:MAG: protein kinase [Acidobacteriota bacterium]
MIGTRLGPYEVTAKLGAGGMGEVYRATDSTLGREVAVKVLPEAFTSDPERLARFEREAKLLAQLNHPNIAHVYGFEASGGDRGVRALVMELVEGEDLSQRLARGPLTFDDALPIAKQIADALEAAHEQGIVHRDLKPANVKVRADGTVKVLDFGLAKALESGTGASSSGGAAVSPTLMNSPTLTSVHGTQLGVILGSAAYMAPEQARGRTVDRRVDIWAFGALLYEMLVGQRAFPGDDVSETLATVIKSDPDWSRLPADTPAAVRRLLRRCLEKDPRRRLSSIGDARLELEEPETAAGPASPASPAGQRRLPWILGAAVAGALLATAVGTLGRSAAHRAPASVARLSILAPAGTALYPESSQTALSPDGTMLAFVVGSPVRADNQLWVRSIATGEAKLLDSEDAPANLFWSPDSRRIGYFTNTKLKTIAASGGRAEVVCGSGGGRGGAWTPSNVIVFASDAAGPLYRVPASGGTPVAVTTLDSAHGQLGHRLPSLLPDGEHFLYVALPGHDGKFDIFAGSLAGGAPVPIGALGSAPVYAEPGWLLFARQGAIAAQRFDARTLKLSGDPVPLADEPTPLLDSNHSTTAGRVASVSSSGWMAYFSSPSTQTRAVWLDLAGTPTGTLDLPPGSFETATISPDGSQAVLVRTLSPSESSLWLVDLARGGGSPFSTGGGRNDNPVWSPDGSRVIFSSDRGGVEDFFMKATANAAPEARFFHSDILFKSPGGWSPDGRWIVFTELDEDTQQDVWGLDAKAQGAPRRLVSSRMRDDAGPISPDGHWLAYYSEETARREVYVQAFPEPGQKVRISEQGGARAWWTPDGKAILYIDANPQVLWRVSFETSGGVARVGAPERVATLPPNVIALEAMPDRKRFLAIIPERIGPGSITIVQNWRAGLGGEK